MSRMIYLGLVMLLSMLVLPTASAAMGFGIGIGSEENCELKEDKVECTFEGDVFVFDFEVKDDKVEFEVGGCKGEFKMGEAEPELEGECAGGPSIGGVPSTIFVFIILAFLS